jgi:hypothetical protein
MAFASTGDNTAGGSGTSASITHSLTINDGDLVVFMVHSNHNSTVPSVDAGGATWTTALAEKPTSETCHHALAWKVAGGSEPSSYSWSVGNADWRVIIKVFSAAAAAVVDTAINSHRQASANDHFNCGAPDGEAASEDAVSIVTGGKDNRGSGSATTVDNGFTGGVGSHSNQSFSAAHKIWTGGGSADIGVTTISGSTLSDNCFSMHISFIESGGAATNPKGPLGMPLHGPFAGPIGP